MRLPNIVVPTIRSAEFFRAFLDSWQDEFAGCHLIVVEDRKKKELQPLLEGRPFTYEIYDWTDIDAELKDKAWIIPRRTDCVRSFGYWKAHQNDALFIVTLDDDVTPEKAGHIQEHWNRLRMVVPYDQTYYSTLKELKPRGYLSGERRVAFNHGGWLSVPDLDADQQIRFGGVRRVTREDFNEGVVPSGALFSVCGMNLAWNTDFTPHMYFTLQGHLADGTKLPIDRMGDIMCGYYAKKKADELELATLTGAPFVIHTRASNPWANWNKEVGWDKYVSFERSNDPDYFDLLDRARSVWLSLF